MLVIVSHISLPCHIPTGKPKEEILKNTIDLDLKALELQTNRLERTIHELAESIMTAISTQSAPEPEFYTVADCARLKGGAALATFKSNRYLLPGCGAPQYAVHIGGRLCFPRAEVQRWLRVTDDEYVEYAESCGVTIPPPKFAKMKRGA